MTQHALDNALSLIALPLISACSQAPLKVVDSLTVSSQNEGVFMSGKPWITGHPLQTSFVSLNGQLALHVGQVCISSRFRSPFNTVCLTKNELSKLTYQQKNKPYIAFSRKGVVETDAYPRDKDLLLQSLINAVNDEKEAAARRSIIKVDYLLCLQKQKEQQNAQKGTSNTLANNVTQSVISCDKTALVQAELDLSNKRQLRQKALTHTNVLVYNWAESLKVSGGVIKTVAGGAEKQASGYTVVNGVYLKRYNIDCDELAALKTLDKSQRLKMVTMTLSTNELYYNANEDNALSAQAALAISPKDFAKLTTWVKDNRAIDLTVDLNTATSIASQGYLSVKYPTSTAPLEKAEGSELVYYAILSDVDSLSCR